MNADKFINSKVGGYIVLGCVAAALIYYISKKAGAAVDALNPMSQDNIVNKAFTSVGAAITGDEGWTLGGSIYDSTHKDGGAIDWAAMAENINPLAGAGVWAVDKLNTIDFDWNGTLDFINPASDQNIIYKGVNSVGSAATGDTSFSLGSWIYDVFHPGETKTISGKVDSDYATWLSNNTDSISEGW